MNLINPFVLLGAVLAAAAIIYTTLLWIDLAAKLAEVLQ